jgi:hypothetical protein
MDCALQSILACPLRSVTTPPPRCYRGSSHGHGQTKMALRWVGIIYWMEMRIIFNKRDLDAEMLQSFIK